MKLLVVSHSCVTPVNQQIFAAIEKLTGWSLTIIGPSNWLDNYGSVRHLERWPAFEGTLRSVPVLLSGNIPLHIYRTPFIQILREEQPEVIFVHHEPYAAATAQIYLANALTTRRPIGFFTWQNIHKKYPIPFRWIENMVHRGSYFAFAGSQSAENVLRQKGYGGPTALLPGTVDPDLYAPQPEAIELRATLCENSDEVLIGYLGRITEAKGLHTLVQALTRLPSHFPWRLILVGKGDFEEELRRYACNFNVTGRITFVGYVPHPEAPRYLSAFDMLVLPSETQPNWKEQFGRVLIEALACGTPVIGSDSGEIPHVINKTEGGLIFPEGNPSLLADRICQLMEDRTLLQNLAERGRQNVLTTYTTNAIAKKFVRTIESIFK